MVSLGKLAVEQEIEETTECEKNTIQMKCSSKASGLRRVPRQIIDVPDQGVELAADLGERLVDPV